MEASASSRAPSPPAPALSVIERLELAVARHASLQDGPALASPRDKTHASSAASRAAESRTPEPLQVQPPAPASAPARIVSASAPAPTSPRSHPVPNSVAALAEQLQTLWRREQSSGDDSDAAGVSETHPLSSAASASAPPLALQQALVKIGSREKDELLVHLLQQVASLRTQLSEVATLGETIAAQLVHQQHALRVKHREQLERLRRELHDATHCHPRVQALEDKIEALEEERRVKDQQLHFAVQKLQRSRRREQELKRLHDPLWDI